jgi:hypothetical protein
VKDLPKQGLLILGAFIFKLVGGIPTPLKNMKEFVSWDHDIPKIYGQS